MNAAIMGQTTATGMHVALTPKALTPVAVVQVSMVMGCHVVISMSAQRMSTTVIGMLIARIHGDHIAALVLKDITEMANSVKVSKSCRFGKRF